MVSKATCYCDICGKLIPNRDTVSITLCFGIDIEDAENMFVDPDISDYLDLCEKHMKEYEQLVKKVSGEFNAWLAQRKGEADHEDSGDQVCMLSS